MISDVIYFLFIYFFILSLLDRKLFALTAMNKFFVWQVLLKWRWIREMVGAVIN